MRGLTAIREDIGPLGRSYVFWTLIALLTASFLLGGSVRDDSITVIALRPIAIICLAIGLFGLTREEVQRFRGLVIGALLIFAIVAIHLIPLPPTVWMGLPGRELAAEAARIGGSADAWRPLTLIPWRGWNTLFSLSLPIAALVLVIRCTDEQRRLLPIVILVLMLASLSFAVIQAAGGYDVSLYPYRVSSANVATGLFANRNHFAVMICCSFPMLAFVAAQRGESGRTGLIRVWLAAVAGAVGLLVLLLTGSRSGMFLGLLALGSLPLVFQVNRVGTRVAQRREYLVMAVIVLAAVLLVALAVYFSRAEAIGRLLATDEKEEVRFSVWLPILNMVKQYFPAGAGAGSFVEVFQIGETQNLLKYTYLNHAHNDWVEVVFELGLAGGVLLLAGFFGWARGAVQLLRAKPDQQGDVYLGRVGAIAILLLGLASLVDYPARVPSIACVAVIMGAWLISGVRAARVGSNPARSGLGPLKRTGRQSRRGTKGSL